MSHNLFISRRAALLGLGMSASLAFPWLADLSPAAEKDKTKEKDKDKTKDKDKDKDKVKDKDKTKDKDKDKDKDKTKERPPKGGGHYGGFGGQVTGGGSGKAVEVSTAKELEAALKRGNCVIHLKGKEIHIDQKMGTAASNITIDGQGCTLRGDKIHPREMQMLNFEGKNIIIKNVRLRNGGDNISLKGASDVVLDHVSSTGSGDDGISIAYKTKNVTVSHCFIGGCTRSIFCKYDPANITINHCIICKFWIRGPIFSEAQHFDFRNNIVQEWSLWGSKAIHGATGNFVGNIWICPKGSKGISDNSLTFVGTAPGPVYIHGNKFVGCKEGVKGTSDKPIDAPAIVPAFSTNLEALERQLMSDTDGAGCMPRDKVDKLYLTQKEGIAHGDTPFRIPDTGQPLP